MNCRRTLISGDQALAESLVTYFETLGMKWKGSKSFVIRRRVKNSIVRRAYVEFNLVQSH